ncbi:hypothetical protein MMF93_03660 [Streptomyces tubbatahanensis]|uniref:Uncharacterized protein n=1 Tax=Streptomyces tubbatahanensis TaxID=2923272 RepID=A0ABY3XML6_9ACTN|nr:hypothetical protein [Streptomyces tubbatahanensis]UNS95681.1 hypothetical protein MMF93_03660 [Streptomyces tubbatahanensis]
MHLAHHLAAVERLHVVPGAHLITLRTAAVDPEGDPVEALEAEREIRAERESLVALLSARWGAARTLDLGPHLLAAADGAELPEPERGLCWHVAELAFWTVRGRWCGVGVARRSPEAPHRLLAAVAEHGRPVPHEPG